MSHPRRLGHPAVPVKPAVASSAEFAPTFPVRGQDRTSEVRSAENVALTQVARFADERIKHPGGRHGRTGSRDRWAERADVHRSWPAYPRHLAALRAEVRRWLAPLALPGDAENDLLLAVNEAASNCVEHAYTSATVDGTVELTFWTETGSVCVEIVDHGAWRTPSGQPTGRGRGIEIMQRLIPVVLIHHDSRGTRVLLSHPLPGPAARIAAESTADLIAANLGSGIRSRRTGATLSAHAPDPGSVVVRALFAGDEERMTDMDDPRCAVQRMVMAVVSDDHNAEVGETVLRAIVGEVASIGGTDGLEALAVELALKVAELVERIATEEGLAAVDIADVLLLD